MMIPKQQQQQHEEMMQSSSSSSLSAQIPLRGSMTRRSIRLSTSSSSSPSSTLEKNNPSPSLLYAPPQHGHSGTTSTTTTTTSSSSTVYDNHRFVLAGRKGKVFMTIMMVMLVMLQFYYWDSTYADIEQEQGQQQYLRYIKNQSQQQYRTAITTTTSKTYNKMTTNTSLKPRIVQLHNIPPLIYHTKSSNYNNDDDSSKGTSFPKPILVLKGGGGEEDDDDADYQNSIHQQRDSTTSFNFLKRMVPDSCELMEDWQTQVLTNCNQFHELDTIGDRGQFLGNGWFRDAWKFHDHHPVVKSNNNNSNNNHDVQQPSSSNTHNNNNNNNDNVVLKMLRLQQDFKPRRYERHRRDAMAMEHLTFSPYVLDIYGYCGQSAINEYATGIEVDITTTTTAAAAEEDTDNDNKNNITSTTTITTVTSLDGIGLLWGGLKNDKSNSTTSTTNNNTITSSTNINSTSTVQSDPNDDDDDDEMWYVKFELGLNLAVGLVHIHYGQSSLLPSFWNTQGQSPSSPPQATLVHYDINPGNIALMTGGKLKFNDFNLAEFVTTAKKKKKEEGKEAAKRINNKIVDMEEGTTNNHSNSTSSSSPCGSFISKFHEPFWRAPEEVIDLNDTSRVNEKVDIFAVGNVLFQILTSDSPYDTELVGNDLEELRNNVANGIKPQLPREYIETFVDIDGRDNSSLQDAVIRCFRMAMDICFVSDPAKRGTAVDVANVFRTMAFIQQEDEASSLAPNHRYRLMKILEKTFPISSS